MSYLFAAGKWNFSNFGKTVWKQFQLPESAKMQIVIAWRKGIKLAVTFNYQDNEKDKSLFG